MTITRTASSNSGPNTGPACRRSSSKRRKRRNRRIQYRILYRDSQLPVFNGEAEKVGRFITACRLYLRMRIRGITVEEWI